MSQDKTQANGEQTTNQSQTTQTAQQTGNTKQPQDDGKVNAEDFASQSTGEPRQSAPSAPSRSESDTTFVENITSKEGLLSALSATLLVLSVPALVYFGATGAITLSAVSGMWATVFAAVFGMAAVRLFGKGTLDAVMKALGKK